ncbi:hypothetical protein SCALM49S_02338 [Streptomyces californicus]
MGNCAAGDREVPRRAPPSAASHGGSRSLEGLADGEFVLTTYGTMRLDAPRRGGARAVAGHGDAASGGVDPAALEVLAADSAVRARRLLMDALAPGHEEQPLPVELTPPQDAVRLAADVRPEARTGALLAAASGRPAAELDAAVRAWRYGGVAALAVLDEEWTPDPEHLERARVRLGEAWEAGATAVVAGERAGPLDGGGGRRAAPAGPGRAVVAVPQGARPLDSGRAGGRQPGGGAGGGREHGGGAGLTPGPGPARSGPGPEGSAGGAPGVRGGRARPAARCPGQGPCASGTGAPVRSSSVSAG